MNSRATILAWLFLALAAGGMIDVLAYDDRGNQAIWRMISAIPVLTLIWAWIRSDRHRMGLAMYSRAFTWLLAFLVPVAFSLHAFRTRNVISAVILITGAIAFLTAGTMGGAVLTLLILEELGLDAPGL